MKLEMFGGRGHGGWSGSGYYRPGIDTPLRACPFCGGNEVTVLNTHTPFYHAECTNCGVKGPRPQVGAKYRRSMSKAEAERLHCEAFDAAITAWNMRGGH